MTAPRNLKLLRFVSVFAISACLALACNPPHSPANALDDAVARVEEDSLPIARAEWSNGIVEWLPVRMFRALAQGDTSILFRAGSNTVALSRRLPATGLVIFGLADSGRLMAGGDGFDKSGNATESIARSRKPMQLIAVASDDKAWMLDPLSGRVVDIDVGLYSHLIAKLVHRGVVQSACAIRDRAILYIDSEHSGYIRVQSLKGAQQATEVRVPDEWIDGHSMQWRDVKFEGAGATECTLVAPWSLAMLVATDSTMSVARPRMPAKRFDATGCGSGFAVLAGTEPEHAKHVVRFYAPNGDSRGLMRLEMHADRIACTQNRMIAIRAYRDSAVMTSYVLPQIMRASELLAVSQPQAPPGPSPEMWRDTIQRQLKARAVKVTR